MPLASQLNGVLTHYVVQYKTIHNAAEAKAACSNDGQSLMLMMYLG